MNADNDHLLKNDWFVKLGKLRNERMKTVKVGDNVIHLEYLNGFIEDEAIIDIENKLNQAQLELSRFDHSGFPRAEIDDYLNVIYLTIQTPLILNIINGTISNFVWDSIKYSIKKIWISVKHKHYIKLTSETQERRNITFGLEVKLNKNTGFNFRLDGDLSEEIIEKTLEKAIKFLKDQPLNDIYKHPYFMKYNTTLDYWEKHDTMEELKKENLKKRKK